MNYGFNFIKLSKPLNKQELGIKMKYFMIKGVIVPKIRQTWKGIHLSNKGAL